VFLIQIVLKEKNLKRYLSIFSLKVNKKPQRTVNFF